MLFISHKTEDKAAAEDLRQRALQRGYAKKQIFLDSDPGSGIEAGSAWERKIYESLKHTRAMIVFCSPNWLKSQWCFVELGYAKAMAISVFPIIIEKCDVGSTLSATQAIDLTTAANSVDRDAAFDRLWAALEEQHLGPKDNLPWPPQGEWDNCPFPGLLCFDEKHAPVFFGREQERATVIRRLKEMRNSGVPRLFMIVGSSGSGKSSLLRAGVLPWLRHSTEQRDWLVLPALRYGESPNDDVTLLARLAEVITDAHPQNQPHRPDWKELREKFESDDVERATRDFVDATVSLCQTHRDATQTRPPGTDQAATTILAIDQFEELLNATARPSAVKFLRFLRMLLSRSNGRLLVIGTMRSDYLDVYEQHAESLKSPFLDLYRLPPFAWDRVTEVIVKPAEKVDVTFTGELITRLKGDAPDSDALPLLAFTLEKLFRQCAGDHVIELREYEQLGGMTGAISQAVARILSPDMSKEIEHALRLSFVKHLAQVNEKDEFIRRPARLSDLLSNAPAEFELVLEEFVRQRLLVKSEHVTAGKTGDRWLSIEVAHEAMFRCWGQLNTWLRTSADILRWRRDVFRSQETAQANRQNWSGLSGPQLAVSRDWPKNRRQELAAEEIRWIETAVFRSRLWASLAITVALVITTLGTLAWWQMGVAVKAQAKANEAENLSREQLVQLSVRNAVRLMSADALANRDRLLEGEDQSAALLWLVEGLKNEQGDPKREMLHRIRIAAHLNHVAKPLRIWHHPDVGAFSAISSDDRLVLTASHDMTIRIWDVATGQQVCKYRSDRLPQFAAFSPDGQRVVVGYSNSAISDLLNTMTGEVVAELRHDAGINHAVFSSDGRSVVTSGRDGLSRFWDGTTGTPVERRLKHLGDVLSAEFSPNGQYLLTFSIVNPLSFYGPDPRVLTVWDATTGEKELATSPDTAIQARFAPDSGWIFLVTSNHSLFGEQHEPEIHRILSRPESANAIQGTTMISEPLLTDPPLVALTAPAETATKAAPGDRRSFTVTYDNINRGSDGSPGSQMTFDSKPAEIQGRPVALSPDGRKIVTLDGNEARLWDTMSGHAIGSPVKHDFAISSAGFSPDGLRIVAWGGIAVSVWDTDSLQRISPPLIHESHVRSARFTSDGLRVLTTSETGLTRLWNLVTDQPEFELEHENGVLHASFSSDGSRVLTTSPHVDGARESARVWDVNSGRAVTPLMLHDGDPVASFTPNGNRVLTRQSDSSCRLWDASTGNEILTTDIEPPLAFSSDGKRVLTADAGKLCVRNADDWHTIATIEPVLELVKASFDPSGARVFGIFGSDRVFQAWNSETGIPVTASQSLKDEFDDVEFSHDVRRFLTVFGDTVRVWNTDPLTPLATISPEKDDRFTEVAFSPDAAFVLTISNQEAVVVWNAETGRRVASIAPNQKNKRAEFSPDGRWILVTTGDLASLWDATTGRPLTVPMLNRRYSSIDAAFSPDGRYIVTKGPLDLSLSMVRVWEARTGYPITPPLSLADVADATLSHDGRHLLTGGRRTAQLWSLVPETRSVENLQRMANVISGHEIDAAAALVPLEPEAICEAWRTIQPEFTEDANPPAEAARRWHRYEFSRAYVKDDWFAAAWHAQRLSAAETVDWKLHAQCGYSLSILGLWKDAAPEYAIATELGSDDPTDWSQAAMTRLMCGEVSEYRAACVRMMQRFKDTADPQALAELIRVCVLAPDAVEELEQLAHRLDQMDLSVVKLNADVDVDESVVAMLVGAVHYRTEKYDQAIARLLTTTRPETSETPMMASILLAMSYHRVGQPDEAKSWLVKASGPARLHPVLFDRFWYSALPEEILFDEATGLIAP